MGEFHPRIWGDYREVSAYAKRTAEMERKVVDIVPVRGGWIIPNHFSHANGGYPDWHYEQAKEEEESALHNIECILAAEAEKEREDDTLMEGWVRNTEFD